MYENRPFDCEFRARGSKLLTSNQNTAYTGYSFLIEQVRSSRTEMYFIFLCQNSQVLRKNEYLYHSTILL
jgi:hypothetical protein